ncbi:MAG: PSP1 domain-containing protein [Nitrospirota bacterium]|nr:PSP1 domain-containing protein [Nitrospirota bacterium]
MTILAKIKVRDGSVPTTYELPDGIGANSGDMVLFEGEWGQTWGIVQGHPIPAPAGGTPCCQKPRGTIERLATEADRQRVAEMLKRQDESLVFCRERAAALNLDMKVLEMEGILTSNNLTCFFTADQRVDFRQLVKDLGGRFRCHVLMRQIGTREEARRSCGVGPCGRTLCCAAFLERPKGVTSQEARAAAPGVSHSKLTGMCGKLMCCLGFEGEGAENAEGQATTVSATASGGAPIAIR